MTKIQMLLSELARVDRASITLPDTRSQRELRRYAERLKNDLSALERVEMPEFVI